MSWILQNKFIAGLIGITVVICAVLLYLGKSASTRYEKALADYRAADGDVSRFERLALYPRQDYLVAKQKAIADYETSIGNLRDAFAKFQSAPPERISPQEFGNRLVATNEKIVNAFNAAGIAIPEAFYSGFESYTTTLAQGDATPVLNYQLGMVDAVMADLTAAGPAALLNFRRLRQPEEAGTAYEAMPGELARAHNFELTFRATEPAARKFLSTLANHKNRYIVVRIVRITSEATDPPKSSNAKFGPAANSPSSGGAGGPTAVSFDELFGNVAEEPAANPAPDGTTAPDGDPAPAPAPPPAPAPSGDGNRILAQVAGSEMVNVFLSFDVMQFLPPADKAPTEP
jgi:hypothetical protein